jgi:ABC-type branched-subunit amino acid transport system permease subunit
MNSTLAEGSKVVYARRSWMPSILTTIGATIYLALFLNAEAQWWILGLLAAGFVTVLVAARLGWLTAARESYRENESLTDGFAVVAMLVLAGVFCGNHSTLLLLSTVLVFVMACLGLNIQFGYAGMLNFSGAAMLGVGGYTAAVLGTYPFASSLLILPIGGLTAALVGAVLLPPMLRTYGHYSAVVTIAFGLLLMNFLEVYDGLGGPQGLAVKGASLFGWDLSQNWKFAGYPVAFYMNYLLLGLALTVIIAIITRRLERSWIGLCLDALRLDETASKCFGINISFWKAVAFIFGNFIVGVAGAFYAQMLGYIAPSNFTFSDSLILVTIILLGGLGSIWGIILTAMVAIILPEKLQVIQEYRFLMYAVLVVLAILFKPDGLIPRASRVYFPGWRP